MNTEVLESKESVSFGFSSSPTIGKIATALVKAQAMIGAAVKGTANPFFKSKYADLAEVIEVCKEPLNENGIAFLQPVVNAISKEGHWEIPKDLTEFIAKLDKAVPKDDILAALDAFFGARRKPRIAVCTILLHESGEFLSAIAEFPTAKEDPQAYFATTTYLRRASLQAILGIPAEDDDGNAAAGRKQVKESESSFKSMFQAFPPGEPIHGVLNAIIPPMGKDPGVLKIQLEDGQMHFSSFANPAAYKPLLGKEIVFIWEKNGRMHVVTEMHEAPVIDAKARAINVQAPPKPPTKAVQAAVVPAKLPPAKLPPATQAATPPDELQTAKDAFAAQYTRGIVEQVTLKTGGNGPPVTFTIASDALGSVRMGCWHSPETLMCGEYTDYDAQDVYFRYTEKPPKNPGMRPFYNIEEMCPADVFDEFVASQLADRTPEAAHTPEEPPTQDLPIGTVVEVSAPKKTRGGGQFVELSIQLDDEIAKYVTPKSPQEFGVQEFDDFCNLEVWFDYVQKGNAKELTHLEFVN